jgi:hypothetical protein
MEDEVVRSDTVSNALDLPTTGHRSIVAPEYRTAEARDILVCRLLAAQSAESRGNGYLRGKATSTLRLSLISACDTDGEHNSHSTCAIHYVPVMQRPRKRSPQNELEGNKNLKCTSITGRSLSVRHLRLSFLFTLRTAAYAKQSSIRCLTQLGSIGDGKP